jgi:CBS domain containing-hemolysin-like protein
VEPSLVEHLQDGSVRVSSRLHVEELGKLFGIELDDDDVDTVGGLLAKHLGRVPIPGAQAWVEGLSLTAETAQGRRNRIGTVLVRRADPNQGGPEAAPDEQDERIDA